MWYPDLMARPQVSCVPRLSVAGQGAIREALYSVVSTRESVRWMQTIDAVWFALFFLMHLL